MKICCEVSNCIYNKKLRCKLKKQTGLKKLYIDEKGRCGNAFDINKMPKFEPSRTCIISESTNLTFEPAEEVKNEQFNH